MKRTLPLLALAALLAGGCALFPPRAESFGSLLARAEAGDADAQNEVGVRYEDGNGVERNYALAAEWYRKSAESDHGQARAFAQNSVGRCYQFGIGVGQNEQEALVWYLKSAEAGNPAAMENLAHCCTTGAGGTRDLEAARSWREKARAVSPDDPVFGRSVRDLLDGDRELEELRERETLTPDEQFWVGSALVSGARNAFDSEEGFRLLRQAAEAGNRNAQRYLAAIYAYGYCGVEKNPAEVLRYARMAAEGGDQWAKDVLERLKKDSNAPSRR